MECGQENAGLVVAHLAALRAGVLKTEARRAGLVLSTDDEGERLDWIRRRAAPPVSCGPEVPLAPARGALVPVAPYEMRATAAGFERQHVGFQGRDAARARDVFDAMADEAARRGAPMPLTLAQVDTGRRYAALVERHAGSGMRGLSVEVRGGGGGGQGNFIDAVIREGEVIAGMLAGLGDAVAVIGRAQLRLSLLVDWVCLDGLVPSAVLRRCGLSVRGGASEAVRAALALALDRMARGPVKARVCKGD